MDNEYKKHLAEVERLKEDYPNVPDCVFDIEASPEMAEMYYEEFGY